MPHLPLVEKKYRVLAFDSILDVIKKIGAKPTITVSSTHYYAHLNTDDTIKMVADEHTVEIHRLSTHDGLHTLEEVIPLVGIDAGFTWFKEHGYKVLDTLSMRKREYDYGDGGLALYEVDHAIRSVVLGYPKEQLPKMEMLFGLKGTEEIALPYNKYLKQLGLLKTITLE